MKKTEKLRVVLLDAHAIIHRGYHALPEFVSSKGEPTGGLYGLSSILINLLGSLKPDYVIACYDLPKPTYRHEVYKDYKAGRAKADDALVHQLQRSRDIFTAFGIPIYDMPGFEADDILGTIVEMLKKNKEVEIVIASGDMDTMQLIDKKRVQVFTMKKGIKDTIMYDEEAVFARFGFGPKLLPDYKGLRGDPSDNIIGIAGIGEKTATDLITKFGSVDDIYKKLKKNKEQFSEAGIKPRIVELLEKGEEEAQFSKTLATIRRDAPIAFELPEKQWKDVCDITKVEAIFAELEFRTLGNRVKELLFGKVGVAIEEKQKEALLPQEDVDPVDFKQAQIALWVLDSNITNPTIDDVLRWTKKQAFTDAYLVLLAEIEKRNLKQVYADIELPLISIIEKMEMRGIKIDTTYLRELGVEYHKELASLEKKIWELAGMEFNVQSPKQLGDVLFDHLEIKIKNAKKTAGGARSTKESELEKMRDLHPIVPLIMSHRELAKLLGTYIDTIPSLVDTNDRLHANFMQTGTTTGRMSSQNPNIQNIPIKSELGRRIRKGFVAEEGFVLAALDYSQIEIRVAAFLSGDEKMIEIFRSGKDVHRAVAAEVFDVSEDDVTPEMRRQAKVINFGIMYGMGVNALKANLGTSREDAQKFYEDYFKKFSGLATYLEKVKADTYALGYTETFYGRRRYFEGIKSKIPYVRAMAERMAINAPIQGTEADIVKIAMINVDTYITENKLSEDVYLLMQVHDELVYEIRADKAEKIAQDIQKIMEEVIDPAKISGVVCTAEYELGRSWGELK